MTRYLILILLVPLIVVGMDEPPNISPQVRINYPLTWPEGELAVGYYTKIKAATFDPDGWVTEVRFYGNGTLLGIATNAPFDIVWQAVLPETRAAWTFTAIARDNLGAETVSAPVRTLVFREATGPDVLLYPYDGTIVAAGMDLEIGAELVATGTRTATWPVDIYFDRVPTRGSFGPLNATNQPVTVIVTNITEGEHAIQVAYREGGWPCYCLPHRIYAVKLGLREPVLRWDGRMEFELVTAYPGRETVIESSGNLADWSVYQTLVPQTNYVRFTVPPEEGKRWFRAVLPAGVGE